MKSIRVLLPLSLISLSVNAIILLAVVLNMDWVKTRAAGGQFENFPVVIRIFYLFMFVLMIALAIWLWNNHKAELTTRGVKFARVVGFVFVLSTLTQLISRSADERWNAIPAAILAITFLSLTKRK